MSKSLFTKGKLTIPNTSFSFSTAASRQNLQTYYYKAIKENTLKEIREIFKLKNAINFKDDEGKTPLCYAAALGRKDVIEWMVDCVNKVNCEGLFATTNQGRNALHIAVMHNQPDSVELLVTKLGQLAQQQDHVGYTPLMIAITTHFYKGIYLLLNITLPHINIKGRDGNTALHLAAYNNNAFLVELLLQCNEVQLDLLNKSGCTPFHFAILGTKKRSLNSGQFSSVGSSFSMDLGGNSSLVKDFPSNNPNSINIYATIDVFLRDAPQRNLEALTETNLDAVHLAVVHKLEETASHLLQKISLKWSSLPLPKKQGGTVLHSIVQCYNLALLVEVIFKDPSLVTVPNKMKMTPMQFALMLKNSDAKLSDRYQEMADALQQSETNV